MNPAELLRALDQLNFELGIPRDDLVRTVEDALAEAYRTAYAPEAQVTAHLNPLTAELAVTARTVDGDGQETITELPTHDLARFAAQAARTAVYRQVRIQERQRALDEAEEHRGELAVGTVDRIDHGSVHVDLGGRREGVMPPEEQIPGEQLLPGRLVEVIILEGRSLGRRAQVVVSRAHRQFVRRLLDAEIPEISAGTVVVRAMAREPGLRTKIAVASIDAEIDACGACIGPNGVRHRALVAHLGSEHVDFVAWSEDPAAFVAAALGPARVLQVTVDRVTNTASVRVPSSQLSLAIGKDGQNARLAARLTGWRIDIRAAEGGDGDTPAAAPGMQ